MLDRTWIESELPSRPETKISHYTRIGSLCHFIPEGSIGWGSAWATPVQFLNDRMELMLGLEVLQNIAKQAYPSNLRIRRILNDLIEQVLVAAASYMKHKGFEAEKEYRLLKFPDWSIIKFRETNDRLVPYVDYLAGKTPLPIHQITIGPGWQLSKLQSSELARNHVVQGIHRLLSARGLQHLTAIESSRIPYDPK